MSDLATWTFIIISTFNNGSELRNIKSFTRSKIFKPIFTTRKLRQFFIQTSTGQNEPKLVSFDGHLWKLEIIPVSSLDLSLSVKIFPKNGSILTFCHSVKTGLIGSYDIKHVIRRSPIFVLSKNHMFIITIISFERKNNLAFHENSLFCADDAQNLGDNNSFCKNYHYYLSKKISFGCFQFKEKISADHALSHSLSLWWGSMVIDQTVEKVMHRLEMVKTFFVKNLWFKFFSIKMD